MEPVEINAGGYYLRQLRADRLLDDRPALVTAFTDPLLRRFDPALAINTPDTLDAAADYVLRRADEWESDRRCSWAVAEPTTGDLLGEVGLAELDLANGTARAMAWVAASQRGHGLATTVVDTVVRFGFGALGLREITCAHAEDDPAARALARRCGFTTRSTVDGRQLWVRGQDTDA